MADINSYALSIEMTLQTNAEQVLTSVVGQINSIETRVQNMIQNLGGALNQLSDRLNQSITQISNSIGTLNANAANLNLAQPVQAMNTAAQAVQQTVGQIGQEFKLPEALIKRINTALLEFSETDWYEDQNVEKAVQAYQYLGQTVLPAIQKIKEYIAGQNMTLSKQESELLEKAQKIEWVLTQKQFKADRQMQQLKQRWERQTNRQYKTDVSAKKMTFGLQTKEREGYKKLLEFDRARLRLGTITAAPQQQKKFASELGNVDARLGETSLGASRLGVAFNIIKEAIGKFGQAVGKVMQTIGLGALAQAATATGLYEVAVGRAAEIQEEFHLINLQTIKPMREMPNVIMKMAIETGLLNKELIESAKALQGVGYSGEEVLSATKYVAGFKRTTGAAEQTSARFLKTSEATTKDRGFALKQLTLLQRANKLLGFTASDLEQIMENVNENQLRLGTTGPEHAKQYQQALINTTNAAKGLGMSTQKAIDIMNDFRDPLKSMRLLGAEAFKLWNKPLELNKRLGEEAKIWLDRIEKVKGTEAEWAVTRAAGQRLGIKDTFKTIEALRLMTDQTKEAHKATEKTPVDPAKELNDTLAQTRGIMRNQAEGTEKALNSIALSLEGVRNAMDEFFKMFNQSAVAQEISKWVIMLGAFLSGLGLVIQAGIGLLGFVGALKMIATAFGTAGGAATGFAAALGVVGTALLTLGGIAAAVAAGLIIGLTIAKLINELKEFIGVNASLDKIVKGTATWKDYLLGALDPIGLVIAGYYRLTRAADEATEAQFKAARAAKFGKSWQEADDPRSIRMRKSRDEYAKTGNEKAYAQWNKDNSEMLAEQDAAFKQSANVKQTVEENRLHAANKTIAEAAQIQDQFTKVSTAALMKGMDEETRKQAEVLNAYGEQAKKQAADIAAQATKAYAKGLESVADAAEQVTVKTTDMNISLSKQATDTERQLAAAAREKLKFIDAAEDEDERYIRMKEVATQLHIDQVGKVIETLESMAGAESKLKDISAVGQTEFEKMGAVATAAMTKGIDMQGTAMAKIGTKMSSQVNQAMAGVTPTRKAEPETIHTVKYTTDTARPIFGQDETAGKINQTNELLGVIFKAVAEAGKGGPIAEILKQYLPAIAEAPSGVGLGTRANKWIT